jgi:hypothetical protein
MSLKDLLARICQVGATPPYEIDRRSLLHAYVACLPFEDLCSAICLSLGEPADIRLALRGRLLRLLRDDRSPDHFGLLVTLVEQTVVESGADKGLRQIVDALHSSLIGHLPLPTQQFVLDRWVDRGTRGAMARWLKATRDHPLLYDADVALGYWRASRDYRAAKSLAYQAAPELLASIMDELVRICHEGWIISKAIVRAGSAGEEVWELVRAAHPATYLYLCAQLGRPITDGEAFELVCRCPGIALHGDRGLAIWAVGQMGKVSVLDRIRDAADALFEKDTADLRARYPGSISSDTPGPLLVDCFTVDG